MSGTEEAPILESSLLYFRPMKLQELTGTIIECAMKVHSELGAGLLESVYEICLAHELRKRGLKVDAQVAVPVFYDGMKLDAGFRIDLLVEETDRKSVV